MTTEFATEEKSKVHLGRNVGRIREIIGMKQIVLAEKTGMSQQNVSKLEQSEDIGEETLDRLAKGLGVTSEFIKTFKEEKAIQYIQNNNDNSSPHVSQNYQPTINYNGIDKISELVQQLLELEKRRIEALERRLEELERRK
jgi:transcriptional regulator with XRE-family HTH domain